MKRPILLILLAYICGIILREYYNFSLVFFSLISLSSLLIYALIYSVSLIKRTKNRVRPNEFGYRIFFLALILFSLFFSFLNLDRRKSKLVNGKFNLIIDIEKTNEEGKYSYGRIVKFAQGQIGLGQEEDKGFSFNLDQELMRDQRVYVNKDLDLGKRYLIYGVLDDLHFSDNFTFSYERYLKSKNIYKSLKVKKAKLIGESDDFFLKAKVGFEKMLEENLTNLGPENRDIGKAIILANDNQGLLKDMKLIGLAHLIAISGTHINIIFDLFLNLGSFFTRKRIGLASISLSILLFYAFIIDFPPAVLRAIIMTLIREISIKREEVFDPINALSLSILFILILNPYNLFSSGLILSSLASLIIYVIYPSLKKKFFSYFLWDKKIFSPILFILVLQIFLLPIQLHYFGYFSFISLISNMVIGPLFELILSALILALIFSSFMYLPYEIVLEGLFYMLNILVEFFKSLRFPSLEFYLSLYEMLAIYALMLFIVFWQDLTKDQILIGLLKKNILVFLLLFTYFYIPRFQITMLDVGQGDCFLIRYKNSTAMIDTGGSLSKERGEKMAETIKSLGLRKIDLLFLSHDDMDHTGYAEIIIDKIETGHIFSSMKIKGINTQILKSEDEILLGNMQFKIFINEGAKTDNDKSMVILLSYGSSKILFTGDIGSEDFLKGKIGKVDILKVSHHGSKTSTNMDFLKEIGPSFSMISVGYKNRYGHPSDKVLKNLESSACIIYRTDVDGAVNFNLTENKIITAKRKQDLSRVGISSWEYILILLAILTKVSLESRGKEIMLDRQLMP